MKSDAMASRVRTRHRNFTAFAALAISAFASPSFANPPPNFDARVEHLMQTAGAPGMAVSIVEDGETVLARGYGVRRLGSADRIDTDTIFQVGSLSKAFTSAALAILVDRGEISWDDPVIDHLPGFQMYDAWVTREMTIRDLLVHRSGLGLGAGDLMFVPRSSLSRAETVRRMRYIRPATSFRSGFAYDNVLYIVAGQVIEDVSGQSWEDFVRDTILRPAGMRSTAVDRGTRQRTRNRAWPHARLNGPLRGLGDQQALEDSGGPRDASLGANANPAGGIAASATDMARWISLQLAHGALPGGSGRLYSDVAARDMWTPQVLIPINPYPDPAAAATPQFLTYALGWIVRDYRGHRLVMHTGAVLGSHAVIVLIPDINVGFSVLVNCEDGEAASGVVFELLDHYLDQPNYDWGAAWREVLQQRRQAALARLQVEASAPAQVGPSLALARYAGHYADPWYGPISITVGDDRLVLDFKQTPGMVGDLTHWQYDTFRVTWRDNGIEPAYVTFALGADGAVDRITMRAVSPLADFSFDYQDLEFAPVAAQ